jgi:CBS domain-containing protein
MSELEDDDYFEAAETDPDMQAISAGVLNDTVATLMPADPVCLQETATVQDAVQAMLARRHAGVMVVDADGRLAGIFTERDVLTRVVGREQDPRRTALSEVMTPGPEALTADDRVAYAVYCMSVAGYRTVPLVDGDGRPVGVVTASDVLRWLADLFPETVLNMRPGDRIKRAGEIDMG